MMLTDDERDLLALIAKAPDPVVMSDLFPDLNPAPNTSLPDEHPEKVAWTKRQLSLYKTSIVLWHADLVEVVVPADGAHGDRVRVTAAGRDALG